MLENMKALVVAMGLKAVVPATQPKPGPKSQQQTPTLVIVDYTYKAGGR